MIPKILHRTVPLETSAEVEGWWDHIQELHPGWVARTWREPIDLADFPRVGHLLDQCENGAKRADLIRLELLATYGGFYVDSDCEAFRPFDPLLPLPAVAAWEDEEHIPNAVMGAEPGNPAIVEALELAIQRNEEGCNTWDAGVGVTTPVFRDNPNIVVLPPGAFYPYHYLELGKRSHVTGETHPWAFVVHHWLHSWGTPKEQAALGKKQR